MKTLPALAFIAALAAFILSPLNFETTVSLLFTAGFAAIVIFDYSRSHRLLPVAAAAAPAGAKPRPERLGLAA